MRHGDKTHCPHGHMYDAANTLVKFSKRGRQRVCRACNNNRQRAYTARTGSRAKRLSAWKRQGIRLTLDEYETMHRKGGGVCQLCSRPIRLYGSGRNPGDATVDHDHLTGEVRGLLCRNCNCGLGLFRDRPEVLASAAIYLGGEYGGITSGCM